MCNQVFEYSCGTRVDDSNQPARISCTCNRPIKVTKIDWRDCENQDCRGCNPTGSSWSYHQRWAYVHESNPPPLFPQDHGPIDPDAIPNDIHIPVRDGPPLVVSGQWIADALEQNYQDLVRRLSSRNASARVQSSENVAAQAEPETKSGETETITSRDDSGDEGGFKPKS
jgi:hypothetical protein